MLGLDIQLMKVGPLHTKAQILVINEHYNCLRPMVHNKIFEMELFKMLESGVHFSTNFHPQTDEQTVGVNALLELYLRNFVGANQQNWVSS